MDGREKKEARSIDVRISEQERVSPLEHDESFLERSDCGPLLIGLSNERMSAGVVISKSSKGLVGVVRKGFS